jgi:hypothetical protein
MAALFGGTTDKPFGLARQRPSPISVEPLVTSRRCADPTLLLINRINSMRRVRWLESAKKKSGKHGH